MTVDKKRKTPCEWCGNQTHQYEGTGNYCSQECENKDKREKQAECNHFTAVNQRIIEGEVYGTCEDCGAEVKELEEEWREA